MDIIWQGTNITRDVQVASCVHHDVSGGRCDTLDIVFENAAAWQRWSPAVDDEIVVTEGAYTTGILYFNSVQPEGGRYRVFATSAPVRARVKAWQSFEQDTLAGVMQKCAAICRMDWRLFGLSPVLPVPYMERENESCAAFLSRLLSLEGAVLKCVQGRLTGISINWAQEQQAYQALAITPSDDGVTYIKENSAKVAYCTVKTPYGQAQARDKSVTGNNYRVETMVPALSDVQAGRFARGLLLCLNRRAERVQLSVPFSPAYTAMTRMDIRGGSDMDGEWLIDEAEHDLIAGSTRLTLVRCLRSIE